jgi:hypothetical protein
MAARVTSILNHSGQQAARAVAQTTAQRAVMEAMVISGLAGVAVAQVQRAELAGAAVKVMYS